MSRRWAFWLTRMWNGAWWMAGIVGWQACAACAIEAGGVRITELMYHPDGSEVYEFVELQNTGHQVSDLAGCSFDGIALVLGADASLKPGQVMVVVSASDVETFSRRYPETDIAGVFTGKLANDGERISLMDANGQVVDRVDYGDRGFWPEAADGTGRSLERARLDGASSDPAVWRASTASLGTPGTVTWERTGGLRLSEVCQAALGEGGDEWIELLNDGESAISIEGWSLSDRASDPRRFVFPSGAKVASGEHLLVMCGTNTHGGDWTTGFGLDAAGETLVLYDRQTNRMDAVTVGPRVAHHAWGIVGAAWTLTMPTPRQSNVAAALAPLSRLSINEWMANAAPGEQDWLELYNLDPERPVLLTGTLVEVNAVCARLDGLVAVAPKGFVRLWADERPGPDHLDLKLPAGGGSIQFRDAAGVTTDRLDYGPQGDGISQGRAPDGAGAMEFFPLSASPGASNVADQDADGLPDFWERRHGLDPLQPEDAQADLDGDGQSNLAEYQAGNDPRDANDKLVMLLSRLADGVRVQFTAAPHRGYTVVASETVAGPAWNRVTNYPAGSSAREVTLDLRADSQRAFYQVRTPPLYASSPAIESLDPEPNAEGVIVDRSIRVVLTAPLQADRVRPESMTVTDPLGRMVAGRLRGNADFSVLEFEPDLPWTHSTRFSATLDTSALGLPSSSEEGFSWTFQTAAAGDLVENRSVYADSPTNVVVAHVSLQPVPGGPTWLDVNADVDSKDAHQPQVPVWFQEEAPVGDIPAPNGTIRQRGQSTRLAHQKSYRIDLNPQADDWHGQRVLNLNKHPYELTRLRNKLSFDWFQELPHFASLRAVFVHLYVDGQDYGLFTHVEHPDAEFLRAHGLDGQGSLYKATVFEFYRYPDSLRLTGDPLYDRSAFERILEIRGDNNHAKLLRMLDDLNDPDIPIASVLAMHFNADNFLTWWAVNILLNNADTASQNFLLYSPSRESVWYFLPWDYDGAWGFYEQPSEEGAPYLSRWQRGLSNWWASQLCRRYLEQPGGLEILKRRVDDLMNGVFTDGEIRRRTLQYAPLMRSVVLRSPDLNHLPVAGGEPATEWAKEIEQLPARVRQHYTQFLDSLELPMPVYLGIPAFSEGRWRFTWSESFDLQGDPLRYDFVLGTSPALDASVLLFQARGLSENHVEVAADLAAGDYFWSIVIRDGKDPDHHWQIPFDSYVDATTGIHYHGVASFHVP